jgi:hypothetical protein
VVNKRERARERGGQDGSSALVVSTLNDGQASAALLWLDAPSASASGVALRKCI